MKEKPDNGTVYDCIIIGAGPGGLQAAIYLGRYNRNVLLIDRSGGRTRHARHIENFIGHSSISGKDLIAIGVEQAKRFNVKFQKMAVTNVLKNKTFAVYAGEEVFYSKFIVVSSGVYDNLPPVENVHKFLGTCFFTCMDCDGHKTTGKKLVIIGNSLHTVHLAFAMKEMFTSDLSLVLYTLQLPDEYQEELREEGITLINGRPLKIIGNDRVTGIQMKDNRLIECEMIMSDFGFKMNDGFLKGLTLRRDANGFKFVVNSAYESTLSGLYIVGPLNTGNDQAVIAAGEGAVAAIDIKKRLLEYG